MIQLRGLSMRDAADEIGVGRGVIEALYADRNAHPESRALIDVWMQLQPSIFADTIGVAVPGSLDYWRGRVEQVAKHMAIVLSEQHEIAAEMRRELDGEAATPSREQMERTIERAATRSEPAPVHNPRKKGHG
jgi:hypothetical protein